MSKKSSVDKLAKAAASLVIAPVAVPVAVASAVKKKHEREAKEEAARLRAGKRYAAEKERRLKEQARIAKQEARSRAIAEEARTKLYLSRLSLEDRYAECIRSHQELCDEIKSAVTDGRTSDVIFLCEKDVALIPMVYDYFTRKSIMEGVEFSAGYIETYAHLSLAYEAMGDYGRAILACKDAIDMGITSGMHERINQLEEKRREMIVYG